MAPDTLVSIALFLVALFVPCESNFFKDLSSSCEHPSFDVYTLLFGNDGPTTLGGATTFSARIEKEQFEGPSKIVGYRFCWQFPDANETCKITTLPNETLEWDKWRIGGIKTVKVIAHVYVNPDSPVELACVVNTTQVTVTDTINAKLKASQEPEPAGDEPFNVGPVELSVDVHDPSHLFKMEDITCVWHFGDGTLLENTTKKTLVHHFMKDRTYYLFVELAAWGEGASGRKFYVGITKLSLEVRANLKPRLVIYGTPGPKLPNPRKGVVVIAVGRADFFVEFDDPAKLVQHVKSQWEFHEDGGQSHKFTSANHTSYNFTKQTNYSLWVTTELFTKNQKYGPFAKHKNLLILEPIMHLNMHHTQHTEKRTMFNVSCQGSGPISFCWYIAKECSLPVNKTICSPTMERKECWIQINHTFQSGGDYCVHLTAENEVSSASTSLEVKIPNDNPATSPRRSASIAVVVVLCIATVLVLAILLRKMMSYKQRPVESANFDFRDEDCRSISSADFKMGRRCFPMFGRCSKRGEGTYLLSSLGTKQHSDLYTELL